MSLRPLAVRISEKVEKEILKIMEYEKTDKATVVRTLLEIGLLEWKKKTALELLRDGKVTFNKAAEIAGLPLWEFVDLVKQYKIEWIKYDSDDMIDELL